MITALRKVSIVPNKLETIDFKYFLSGLKNERGSLGKNAGSSQPEVGPYSLINFEESKEPTLILRGAKSIFSKVVGISDIRGTLKVEPTSLHNFVESEVPPPKLGGLNAYSLYINPAAFFDPTFILIGAGIVVVAVLEKKLADNGLITIASFLSTVLRLSLPVVALGSIIYLINHASFLL